MEWPPHIDCSSESARSVFLDRGLVTPPIRGLPGFSQSSDAAWDLLAGYVRHRMDDGTIVMPDSLGRWHLLSPRHRFFPDGPLVARAFDDNGGCAIVSPALINLLVSASFGIWCFPGFEPRIGEPARIDLPPIAPGLPLGFEGIMLPRSMRVAERAILEGRRDWLDGAIAQMCPVRHEMAMATARFAAHWIWAHETGHLLGGHHLLDIGGLADVAGSGGDQPEAAEPRTQPQLALEVLADRFATRLLAGNAKTVLDTQLRPLAIGGLLAMSLFETSHVLSGREWKTASHPGNWFRAQSFLDELEAVAGRSLDLLPMLSSLAQTLGHCGLWLVPALDGGYRSLADRFAKDAFDSLSRWFEALRAHGSTPLADQSGLSTDLFLPVPLQRS